MCYIVIAGIILIIGNTLFSFMFFMAFMVSFVFGDGIGGSKCIVYHNEIVSHPYFIIPEVALI